VTSPLGLVGLTYAGTDLQQADLQWFFQIVRGLNEPPSVRGDDTIVPYLAGRVEGSRENDVLTIELRGNVRADPDETTTAGARASFADNRATIRGLFHPKRDRADLVATLENGAILTISARPLPGSMWSEQVGSEWADVSIELEGYDDWAEVTGS
jgi:hypothetical protein